MRSGEIGKGCDCSDRAGQSLVVFDAFYLTLGFKCDRGPKCTGTLPSKCTAQCDTNLINHSNQPFEPVPFQGWQK